MENEILLKILGSLESLEKGQQRTDDRLDQIEVHLGKIDERLDGMDERLDGIDERLDGIDKRLDGIDKRLDGMDERLAQVEEDTKITRSAVNVLLAWAEDAQVEVKIPLYKQAE